MRLISVILQANLIIMLSIHCAAIRAENNQALYELGGKRYFERDLDPAAKQKLYELKSLYYKKFREAMDLSLLNQYIDQEMAKSNKSRKEVHDLLFEQKFDKDLFDAWIKERKGIATNVERRRYMRHRKLATKEKLVQKMKDEGNYKDNLRWPIPPKVEISTKGFPVFGAKDAKVTIVSFYGFYRCDRCLAQYDTLEVLNHKYKGKVKIVYMFHDGKPAKNSTLIAKGLVCAASQNKFLEYLDLAILEMKQKEKYVKNYAKDVGLNMDDFSDCLDSSATTDMVYRSYSEAKRLGVDRGSVYVNGVKLYSIRYEDYIELIENSYAS